MSGSELFDIGLVGFVTRTVYFLVLIALGWWVLRQLDKAAGVPFKDVLSEIRKDSRATALYYGCRILAIAVLGLAVF